MGGVGVSRAKQGAAGAAAAAAAGAPDHGRGLARRSERRPSTARRASGAGVCP